MEHKKVIEKIARDLGFSKVGFTTLEKNSLGSQRFDEWLSKGFAGEMKYLERGLEKRKDPQLILPQAKSALVLAWDYSEIDSSLWKREVRRDLEFKNPPLSPFVKGGSLVSPFISRYAWGKDYHEVLGDKLSKLEEKLKEIFPDESFKSYVDTGPVMEKDWAAKAGLGWLGKHTNLIIHQRQQRVEGEAPAAQRSSPLAGLPMEGATRAPVIDEKEGSYFFLASLLTTLDLSTDKPVQDRCGTCTRCIDVCPTRAIVAPYEVDARLCISYLTIELKGSIPVELRPLIGNHVFGCDDCQEVCPWNRHAKLPEEFLRNVPIEELHEWLELDEKQFKEKFKNSPILRAKRRGFLRNVCVVLGNLGRRESVPYLSQALQDPEPLVREHAAWALEEIKG